MQGSDSQRPFAIVMAGGLIAALGMIFLLPTLYAWIAGAQDVLPAADGEFADGEHID
jgi:cobalt-zinc-cadmium resistance protein CzcA